MVALPLYADLCSIVCINVGYRAALGNGVCLLQLTVCGSGYLWYYWKDLHVNLLHMHREQILFRERFRFILVHILEYVCSAYVFY